MNTMQSNSSSKLTQSALEPTGVQNSQVAKNEAEIITTPDKRQNLLLSAQEFISQHSDLIGLPLSELTSRLNDALYARPVNGQSTLDCIALLRALTPEVTRFDETHYVLLFSGFAINGFAWIPAEPKRKRSNPDANNVIEYHSETQALFRSVLNAGSDKLFIASTRTDRSYSVDGLDDDQSKWLWEAFDRLGIELTDYVLFYDDVNCSCNYDRYGDDGIDEGVTIDQVEVCGIKNPWNRQPDMSNA